MSRFLLKAALVLGSVSFVAGSARAELRTYGAYASQADADAVGQAEIDNNGATGYGAGYQTDDPEEKGRGPGYYVTVIYPDAPAPTPNPGGLLGVPFPGGPGSADPADPGAGDPDPADPGAGDPDPADPGPDDGGGE